MNNLKEESIAIIIPDFDFGGEEKRVVLFANHYTKYFKNVYVIAPMGKSMNLLNSEVKHIYVNVRNYLHVFKVLNILRLNNIKFFQGHKRATLPYLLMAEKLLNVSSNFNFDNIYPNNYWFQFIMPKNIIYLSEILLSYYQDIHANNNNVLINMGGDFLERSEIGLIEETRKRLGLNDSTILLNIGRLAKQKNQKCLINSLTKFDSSRFKLVIVGEGELENELKVLVNQLELTNVIFLGHRTDIALLLSISDIYVQTSIFEGFPNTLIEAASIGLPIIATDVGASRTVVKDNGILVETHDTKELAQAFEIICNNMEDFKQKAYTFSQSTYFHKFKRENMLNNYIEWYQSI